MLYEIITNKKFANEYNRRWFESEELDLVIWINNSNQISSFQLCYKKGVREQVLTWKSTSGFTHETVDDGESRSMRHKSSPILVSDGQYNAHKFTHLFNDLSKNIDGNITKFVLSKLAMCSESQNGI